MQGSQKPVIVKHHPAAESELAQLDNQDESDARNFLRRIHGQQRNICIAQLQPRSERKVFKKVIYSRRGALRILFYWGADGTLWFIGAYLKNNNKQGERYAGRVLKRTADIDRFDQERLKNAT